MGTINRRQFLEDVIASQIEAKSHVAGSRDEAFEKYANKKLPDSHKTTSSLALYSGTWSATQAKHLLRRTTFGVKDADNATLLAMTMTDAVDYLLNNIPPAPNPPVNDYSNSPDITGVLPGQTWVNAPVGDGNVNAARNTSYKAWWFGLLVDQNLSLQEKMVFFWHNHFATQTYVVGDARFNYDHNVLLRANALGNFKTLVNLVTTDPSMLMYLGGYENTKNDPDENYGRELQELFTVGKNNTPNYTEDDVKAASKILTGWRINNSTKESFFLPEEHDVTDKQFSSFYNNTVIAGESGANGANETAALIDMIFTRPETAHYLCTKLYRFFVYYNIDAAIDASIIQPLAQILIDNNFEIKPVLQTLLKSEHFYDPNNIGCYIRTPLDFLAGTCRTLDLSLPGGTSVTDTAGIHNYLRDYGAQLGLDLGDPPNVAGWQPFYESPAFYEIWINSSTYPLRLEFTDMILTSGFNANISTTVSANIPGFTQQFSNASDPDALIDSLAQLFLGIDISEDVHNSLKNILMSGQTNNSYWATAWSNYLVNPSTENTSIVNSRLTALLVTMLRMPEHQLC